jgi:hypothetical protein
MKRLVFALLGVAAFFALGAASALAKGASEATITGPGLDGPIALAGEGRVGGERLMQIAEAAGFFPAVFAQTPDPMLDERPAGDLGPKYTIAYVMPGPNGENEIVQDVYPYAQPDPVTYTAPGQSFFGTERTRGGWFLALGYLKDDLVEAGLPPTPPVAGDDDGVPWTTVGGLVAAAAALALGALGAYVLRRRPSSATA